MTSRSITPVVHHQGSIIWPGPTEEFTRNLTLSWIWHCNAWSSKNIWFHNGFQFNHCCTFISYLISSNMFLGSLRILSLFCFQNFKNLWCIFANKDENVIVMKKQSCSYFVMIIFFSAKASKRYVKWYVL